MKLKKTYIYIISFFGLSMFFTFCYYASYKHALNQFNKRAVERDENLLSLDLALEPTPSIEDDLDSISVGAHTPAMIKPTTKHILQTYDLTTDTVVEETLNMPGHLVGLTREETISYLLEYMEDVSLSEHNKGLVSYDLVSFSEDKIILRKSYNIDKVAFMFYVAVRDSYVIIYNSDLKSIYRYTHIEAEFLPEADRVALVQGIYIKNLEELYSLLESYSS